MYVSLSLLGEAINVAFDSDFTVYDSVFLALGKASGCKIVTADVDVLKKSAGGALSLKDAVLISK